MLTTEIHSLSKSAFVVDCLRFKTSYLNKFHKEIQSDISSNQEAIFEQGNDVGVIARKVFRNGIKRTYR